MRHTNISKSLSLPSFSSCSGRCRTRDIYIKDEPSNTYLCAQCEERMIHDQIQTLPVNCDLCDWIDQLINCPDLCHSNWTCHCCDCKKMASRKKAHKIRILLRRSASHRTKRSGDIKKITNIVMKRDETMTVNIEQFRVCEVNLVKRSNEEYSQMRLTCQQQNDSIEKLKLNQYMMEKDILLIQQKMEDLHYVSYDGTLTWKITNVAQKLNDAQSGQQLYIESPLFHSSPTGYQMRARLYLNGDGDARDTHMSIFLVLVQGEYDALLRWPFNFPVTFCLHDQTGQKYHVIDTFEPDPTLTNCQRPSTEMNIAGGISKFCPSKAVEQEGNCYSRHGTMFIKIVVNFDGTRKNPLLYTIILDDDELPAHVREAKRRQEAERQEQLRAALDETNNRDEQIITQLGLVPSYPLL